MWKLWNGEDLPATRLLPHLNLLEGGEDASCDEGFHVEHSQRQRLAENASEQKSEQRRMTEGHQMIEWDMHKRSA